MDRDKAKGYLSIANKAGYLIIGGDKLSQHKQKLYLVLVDESAGKSSLKIAARFEGVTPVLEVAQLGELSGIATCKILGVKNKNLSDLIQENLTK